MGKMKELYQEQLEKMEDEEFQPTFGTNVQAFSETLCECLEAFEGHGFQAEWEEGRIPLLTATKKTDGSRGLSFPLPSCEEECGYIFATAWEDGVHYGKGDGALLFKGHHPSHLAAFIFGLIITNTPFHPPLCPCCAKKKDENSS